MNKQISFTRFPISSKHDVGTSPVESLTVDSIWLNNERVEQTWATKLPLRSGEMLEVKVLFPDGTVGRVIFKVDPWPTPVIETGATK